MRDTKKSETSAQYMFDCKQIKNVSKTAHKLSINNAQLFSNSNRKIKVTVTHVQHSLHMQHITNGLKV